MSGHREQRPGRPPNPRRTGGAHGGVERHIPARGPPGVGQHEIDVLVPTVEDQVEGIVDDRAAVDIRIRMARPLRNTPSDLA